MKKLSEYFGSVDEALEALEANSGPGVRFWTAAKKGSLWNDGFVSTLTLWSDGLVKVGLMASPGGDPSDWRGIIATDGHGLTLSRDARTLVPRYLLVRFLSDNAEGLAKLCARSQTIMPLAGELHAALGGEPRTLAVIEEIVNDPTRHAAFSATESQAGFEVAMSALSRKVDTSDAFRTFADWLDNAVKGKMAPPENIEAMEPWTRLCFCWAFKAGAVSAAESSLACDLIETFPGLDAGPPAVFGWNIWPGMTSAEATIISLAEEAIETLDKDSICSMIAAEVATKTFDYSGLAHADGVARYAEAGDPVRALNTLSAAAWWMARRLGRPAKDVRDGLQLLCHENNWGDLLWVGEREWKNAK